MAGPEEKIEPTLLQQAEEQEELHVIIFIKSPDLRTASAQVKKRFDPEIDALSEEIRAINRKYRPQRPLSPTEVKEFVRKAPAYSRQDQNQLRSLHSRLDELMDEKKGAICDALEQAARPILDEVADYVTSYGGLIHTRVYVISALGATIPADFLEMLSEHPLVLAISKEQKVEPLLNNSMPSTGFDTWWSGGFTGGPYDVGIIDTGVQEDHPAFSAISFITNSGIHTDPVGHGTHVAGIIASADATYRGGAYGLETIVWSQLDPGNETGTWENTEWQAHTASQKPEVINHSLRLDTIGNSDYIQNDRFWDAFIVEYDILVTQAAGNREYGLYLERPSAVYNLITVANMDDQGSPTRIDDLISTTSSPGPTPAGRKKPDITAPGHAIMSCNYQWDDWFTDNFVEDNGTSMAAPHVAAAIISLEDGGNHSAMAQKAVLINTADAWTSNDTDTPDDDGPTSGSHWDRYYGWGYLNMEMAFYYRSDYFLDSVVPNNGTAADDDYKLYKGYMQTDQKATLVWRKRVAYMEATTPDEDDEYKLSDLDIILFDEADSSLKGWDTGNTIDNVHQVCTPSNVDGVIKVYAVDTSFEGATKEDYALATVDFFETADPPSFDVSLSVPASVETSTDFTVTIDVTNNGDVKAHNNSVTLSLPGGFSVQLGANPQNIGTIAAGATGQATWTVSSSATPGGTISQPQIRAPAIMRPIPAHLRLRPLP